MSTVRRFLVAPSFARLIQREREATGRIVEAYFPPRPDRRQLVRVEQHQAWLILLTQAEDGRFAEEQTEIPLPHAEGLIGVAAGTVAYDRTTFSLGGDIEAVLDRFIIPQGLDLLAVTTPSDPHAFAPPAWFGLEVTDEPAFEALELALQGAPNVDVMEPTNPGLDALLDTLEGRSLHQLRPSWRDEGEGKKEPAGRPPIPDAVELDAFHARTASQSTTPGNPAEDQSDPQGNMSIRRIARTVAPRTRDNR